MVAIASAGPLSLAHHRDTLGQPTLKSPTSPDFAHTPRSTLPVDPQGLPTLHKQAAPPQQFRAAPSWNSPNVLVAPQSPVSLPSLLPPNFRCYHCLSPFWLQGSETPLGEKESHGYGRLLAPRTRSPPCVLLADVGVCTSSPQACSGPASLSFFFSLKSADAQCVFSSENSKGTESSGLSELALPHWAELFGPKLLCRVPAGLSVDCLLVKGPSLVPPVSALLPGIVLLGPQSSVWALGRRVSEKSMVGAHRHV